MAYQVATYDRSLIRLRFIGERLNHRAIPVYELGVSLIAIQRAIHKAHLLELGQETKRAYLPNEQRSILALQLAGRKRDSDGYGLVPLLNAVSSNELISGYVGNVLSSLTSYAARTLLRRPKETPEKQFKLSVLIFNQVSELSGRINDVGGIEKIEISTPHQKSPAIIDQGTKGYVNSLRDKFAYGETSSIRGRLIDLLPTENAVKIRNDQHGALKILLPARDFEMLRYSPIKSPLVEFVGEPMYRLGVEIYNYEAFNAASATIIAETGDEDFS